MEEIGEGALRVILRFIRTVLIEGICESLLYWIGRLFLLLLTLGRYPRAEQTEEHEGRIMFVGFLVVVALVIIISLFV
jgi:hypothetical protein